MKLKDILYLIWYSIKDLLIDLIELISALKKAKTWSFILYATIFLLAYYRSLTRTNAIIVIAFILILYIIRQHKEPNYNKSVKERAFRKHDDEKTRIYYEKYKNHCYYSKKEIVDYEEYKKRELMKLDEKKYIQLNQDDALY